MPSNPLPANSSRLGGCTLTGALSVTSHVRDTITIIHGPKGCAHHNASLLHAVWLENDQVAMPSLMSTALGESDVIFGGEDALRAAIRRAADTGITAVFVLSTCIADTIGDDTGAVCAEEYGIPVISIPTAGFLGGTFQDGMNNALIALARLSPQCSRINGINLIGEMNLEYEVQENASEVIRLLSLLGQDVNLRFVHDITFGEIGSLGSARLNILRSPALIPVGEFLNERFGTPYIASFPHGLAGTLTFLEEVAGACGLDAGSAVALETACQNEMITAFSDLRPCHIVLDQAHAGEDDLRAAMELAGRIGLPISETGDGPILPIGTAIGSGGLRRMLHRWRRALHA